MIHVPFRSVHAAFVKTLRRFSLRLLPLLIAVAFILTLLPSPAAAKTNEASFAIDEAVSAEDAGYVVEGIRLAQDFFVENAGATFNRDLQVKVDSDYDELNPDLLVYWDGRSIVVHTGAPAWSRSTPAGRIATLIHEFTHVYQTMMLGVADETSPAWVEEGIAEYLSYYVLDELGIIEHSEVQAFDTAYLGMYPPEYSLPELASWRRFQRVGSDAYPLSHMAVARLMEDVDLSVVGFYYGLLSRGMPLEDVFELTFGVPLTRYYEAFDQWLSTWTLPDTPLTDERFGSPVNHASPVELTDVPVSLTADDQFLVQARASPAVVCSLGIVDVDDSQSMVERTTFADSGGGVFWLVTLPAGSPDGLVSIEIDCGGPVVSRAAFLEAAA